MILGACLLVLAKQTTPVTTKSFQYSGLPTVSSSDVDTVSADIHFTLANRTAKVTELILFKNKSSLPVDAFLFVPRYVQGADKSGQPNFVVAATWDKADMTFTAAPSDERLPVGVFGSALSSPIHLGAGATSALRVSYSVPYGKAGYGHLQSVAGFHLPGPRPDGQSSISQLNFSFSYNQHSVFGLPTLTPNWTWEVGQLGSSTRQLSYLLTDQMVTATFYPGDFGGGQ